MRQSIKNTKHHRSRIRYPCKGRSPLPCSVAHPYGYHIFGGSPYSPRIFITKAGTCLPSYFPSGLIIPPRYVICRAVYFFHSRKHTIQSSCPNSRKRCSSLTKIRRTSCHIAKGLKLCRAILLSSSKNIYF